jgi:hypothetical protein
MNKCGQDPCCQGGVGNGTENTFLGTYIVVTLVMNCESNQCYNIRTDRPPTVALPTYEDPPYHAGGEIIFLNGSWAP